MDFDFTRVLDYGLTIAVLMWFLRWFMGRFERVLNRLNRTIDMNTRAVIRLLERHDPAEASRLSRELYQNNGDYEGD